jgi:hypothetical protein
VPARLARVLFVVVLLAGWQAALEHPIEHGSDSHERSSLCDTLAALTACVHDAVQLPVASERFEYSLQRQHHGAPRMADAPPFLSQGPPAYA